MVAKLLTAVLAVAAISAPSHAVTRDEALAAAKDAGFARAKVMAVGSVAVLQAGRSVVAVSAAGAGFKALKLPGLQQSGLGGVGAVTVSAGRFLGQQDWTRATVQTGRSNGMGGWSATRIFVLRAGSGGPEVGCDVAGDSGSGMEDVVHQTTVTLRLLKAKPLRFEVISSNTGNGMGMRLGQPNGDSLRTVYSMASGHCRIVSQGPVGSAEAQAVRLAVRAGFEAKVPAALRTALQKAIDRRAAPLSYCLTQAARNRPDLGDGTAVRLRLVGGGDGPPDVQVVASPDAQLTNCIRARFASMRELAKLEIKEPLTVTLLFRAEK